MAAGGSDATEEFGACGSGPAKKAESSSHGAGVEQHFHHATRRKMAAGSSEAAKESGACVWAPPAWLLHGDVGAGPQTPDLTAGVEEVGSSAAIKPVLHSRCADEDRLRP
ncbi:hypothetical protein NDU88_007685 [Pleurodeles waltl]|uniref:Uncharacterized protein n=1 Tax=Pleurodeles waltl TaxID=8319 RepID=A0AAV7N4S8_PLEWA|nr:hypothetical protein NDU88_007685 [Pleurodeles waltl]